jgi:serine/threonine protein kinase
LCCRSQKGIIGRLSWFLNFAGVEIAPMDTRRDYSASVVTPPGDRAYPSPPAEAVPDTPPTRAMAPAPAPAPLWAVRPFGRYLLLREIAVGGMGVVYEAHDPLLDRIVALKMIRGGVFAGPNEIVRFEGEARAAAHLSHRHIVQVYDVGEIDGQHFFTMAFAPGGSLAGRFAEFAGNPEAAVPLVEKVARAVAFAHSKGILHRDLKPGNVLLGEGDEPLVSDFGLAKFLDESLELTHTGQRVGTPAYMAPEQASGQTERIGPAVDVWSLGVVLYQLLTGVRPFVGDTAEILARQILTTEPLSPRSIKPGLDRQLETVVMKCLEKDPARRYESAEALADDLARWQRGEPVLAKPPSWPRRTWRTLRRPAVMACLLNLGLLGLVPLLWRPDTAERQREAIEARLAKGETVVLIGDTGPPAWSRAIGKPGEAILSTDAEEPFEVRTTTRVLVELLPGLPVRKFRLRAEVRHLKGTPQAQVGLYVGRSNQLAADGAAWQCLVALTLNDAVVVPPRNLLALRLCWWQPEAVGTNHGGRAQIGLGRLFAAAGAHPQDRDGPWRKLALEFEPTLIRSYFNGALVDSVPRGQMMSTKGPAMVRPDYLPEQGLGLFVDQASVLFRRVVVEPLDAGH